MNSKFRVWDGEEMYYPPHDYVMFGAGRLKRKFKRGEFTTLEPVRDKAEAMHYTGLDDAEGTPIYESDVVEAMDHMGDEGDPQEVQWSPDEAAWIVYPHHLLAQMVSLYEVRVVGNKFQTPELLD